MRPVLIKHRVQWERLSGSFVPFLKYRRNMFYTIRSNMPSTGRESPHLFLLFQPHISKVVKLRISGLRTQDSGLFTSCTIKYICLLQYMIDNSATDMVTWKCKEYNGRCIIELMHVERNDSKQLASTKEINVTKVQFLSFM